MTSAPDPTSPSAQHSARLATLSAAIRAHHATSTPFRIYHGSTTSTRRVRYDAFSSVDISDFTHVLGVSRETRTATCEPAASMHDLVTATLPLGLVPAVVPEFGSITVGGCFAGTGGESSSFREGLFDDTVSAVEVVLGNGEVRESRRGGGGGDAADGEELLKACAGAYGSLGVVTRLEVKLVPAKAAVQVEYWPVGGANEALRRMEEETARGDVGFLDGILYGGGKGGVVMVGRFVDLPGTGKVQRFTRRGDDWFYMHVEKILDKSARGASERVKSVSGPTSSDEANNVADSPAPCREVIPTYDYLFRYDRACFWTASYALDYFYVHNTAFARWLGDPLLCTTKLMHAMQKAGLMNRFIIQDISVPYHETEGFVAHVQKELDIYPLWLCPLLLKHDWPLRPKDSVPQRLMNVGIWGHGSKKLEKIVEQNRELERRAREAHGLKCLYAQCFYTEEEFWQIYDKGTYDALRTKYHADTLPTVFDKVCKCSALTELERRKSSRKARAAGKIKDFWILRGLYGTASVLKGSNYLMRKPKGQSTQAPIP